MKKRIIKMAHKGVIMLAAMMFFTGCGKDEIEVEPLATVSVVNAVIDGKVVRMNDNLRDSCLNMNFKHLTIIAGNGSPIKVWPSGSASTPYYSQSPNTAAGDIYTLFLTGTHSSPDAVLVKENIPPYGNDEVIRLRVINLSPNSPVLTVNLASATGTNIFTGLGYKQYSEFRALPLPLAAVPAGTNVFQFRDAGGTIVATYTLPPSPSSPYTTVSQLLSRYRNVTLAVKGNYGIGSGSNAFGVFPVPHY